MTTLDHILKTKPNRRVLATVPHANVHHAVEEMCSARVGSILVVDELRPVGLLSERDLLTRVLLKKRDPHLTRVSDVMTREILAVHHEATPESVLALMTQRELRHLLVVDDAYVIGIISMGDLARCSAGDQLARVEAIANYVMEPGRAHVAESAGKLKGATPASDFRMRAVVLPGDVKRRS